MDVNFKKINKMNFFQKLYNKVYLLYLKLLGAKIENSVRIYGKIKIIGDPNKLIIKNHSTINFGVLFNCRDIIEIGKNVRISPYAQFHTGALNLDPNNRIHYNKKIIVKDNVWICSGAIVNPGIVIEKNSVLLPGSVLNINMEENSVYGGVPAKFIKKVC